MGNTFGFLRPETDGGFKFSVLDACKAEHIDLSRNCNLDFGPGHELLSIGNIKRGSFTPNPGIAGEGIWRSMISMFAILFVALGFLIVELRSRFETVLKRNGKSRTFIRLFKSPSEDDDADGSGQTKRYRSKIRALIRVFVLATSDYQIILVGAFILSYAGKGKCELTSYHFTTTVDLMMISLSVIVFSVALVRTYWRHPVAALFRVLLSVTVFIGVALTVFEKNSYSPEWIPPRGRHDSAILLPVACLLEPDLYLRAKSQSEQSQADLGFHSPPSRWPAEKYFYILLALAFLTAHVSVMVRRLQGRLGEGNPTERKWSRSLGKLTIVYWLFVLLTPAGVIIACWVRIYLAREWVRGSGWISEPNPEFNLWDSGQLLPIVSGVVLILMATATEAKSTKAKAD